MVTLLIGGDTGPAHGPADGFPKGHYTQKIAPQMDYADFRLLNCMRTYSDLPPIHSEAPQVAQPKEMADLYFEAGVTGLTMANNHAWDSGEAALLETISLFERQGIKVTGAGRDLESASQPILMEKDGLRIAYLGVTSLGKAGGMARPGGAGVFNLEIETRYEHRGAHAPVRVVTKAVAQDLEDLLARLRRLRGEVDYLIVAFHSGVIRLPRVIADYQVEVCRAMVEAGADLIVCHAPHLLKGVEVWQGKPIFYSIGVFAMTKPFAAAGWAEPAWAHGAIRNHTDLDPDCPIMPYGADCRLSLLVEVTLARQAAAQIAFRPMQIDTLGRPFLPEAGSADFERILSYMEWVSADLAHRFTRDGARILVTD